MDDQKVEQTEKETGGTVPAPETSPDVIDFVFAFPLPPWLPGKVESDRHFSQIMNTMVMDVENFAKIISGLSLINASSPKEALAYAFRLYRHLDGYLQCIINNQGSDGFDLLRDMLEQEQEYNDRVKNRRGIGWRDPDNPNGFDVIRDHGPEDRLRRALDFLFGDN